MFNIKEFLTENQLTYGSKITEAKVKGVKLTPEEEDWLMFALGPRPVSQHGPLSPEEAIKVLTKDMRKLTTGREEQKISKALISKIKRLSSKR